MTSIVKESVVRADARTTGSVPTAPRRRRLWTRNARVGLLFVLPAAVYVGIFHLAPVIYGFVISLTDFNPLSRDAADFVGGDNYGRLLQDPAFGNALLVTGQYVLLVLPITVILALGLAMLVNRPFKGVGIVRSAMYVPHIVSLTAVSMIWLWMYSQNGLFNEILSGIGLPTQSWLLEQDSALTAVAAMRIWKALGSNMVLLLAGLQTVPRELYEAGRVDGAGAWQLFRHITLPSLRPILVYVVAMDIIFLAQGFAEIYVLTGGGPLGSTTTVNYIVYTEAFQYNRMGDASAMAFVLFAFIAAASILSVKALMGRREK
ncbi:carbohydrate ABC transporter permease [Microbacterium sp. NPDC058342]|uniref:carbohydrate ABC transporter permease n=1 Tax=Microbacterium sp. NPDC058342 TaxID=3346454 RepID=UPI0036515D22